jgi:hypothetical protein
MSEQPNTQLMTMLQTSQNKMLRTLDGALDQKSTKIPLDNQNILSVHLTSPHLTSPHLTSPHLTSPFCQWKKYAGPSSSLSGCENFDQEATVH